MPIPTSDLRSNYNDQIRYAIKVIGNSPIKQNLFKEIYYGKKEAKTIDEIRLKTKLTRKQIIDGTMRLKDLIIKEKKKGKIYYKKDPQIAQIKNDIIKKFNTKNIEEKIPSKYDPKITIRTISIKSRNKINVKTLTIDDTDSFNKVKKIKSSEVKISPISEKYFNEGLQKILGEITEFKDWGGEQNDLFSTRMRIKGKRYSVAMILKGEGFPKVLTAKYMGKRGDQLMRLSISPAKVFVVQHWGVIDQSIIQMLEAFLKTRSTAIGEELILLPIDGLDSQRIIKAYPKFFKIGK